MSALIYFSYGMTKSGSTLGYELARSAFEHAGYSQPRLSLDAVEFRKNVNFVNSVDEQRADAIRNEIKEIGHPIAIKTHSRPDPEIVKMLETGEATAHAIYRDPRDIGLSMLDHGERARARGKPSFSEFHKIEDTFENIRHQTNTLLAWLSLPNVRPMYYEDIAFNMSETATRLVSELNVDADIPAIMQNTTNDRFTQKNKAVSNRHSSEMSKEVSDEFLRIFAPLFERLINNRDQLARDGSPVLDPQHALCLWD